MRTLPLLALIATHALAQAADTLVMVGGERRTARVLAVDGQSLSVEVQIVPGQPPGTMRVPRNQVAHIEFSPDATRDSLIARGTTAQLGVFSSHWIKLEPLVGVPRSPAARFGVRYASLLLETRDPAHAGQALTLYEKIEAEAWNPEDRAAAKQGRLRALIAVGKTEQAETEARQLLKAELAPELQAEARYLLARVADERLRKLLEENPRWEEDDRVRPERHRLYHEAIDLYLYPALFAGAAMEPASRGLWGAVEIYRLTGETLLAVETSRDIIALYPSTTYARLAQEYLNSLPEQARRQDSEKDARVNSPALK